MVIFNWLKRKPKISTVDKNIDNVSEDILKKEIEIIINQYQIDKSLKFLVLDTSEGFMQFTLSGKNNYYLECTLEEDSIQAGGYPGNMGIKPIKNKYLAFYDKKLNKQQLTKFMVDFFNSRLEINPADWCFVNQSHMTFGYGDDSTAQVKGEKRPKGFFTRISFYSQDRSPNSHGKMVNTENVILAGHILPRDCAEIFKSKLNR